VILVMAEEERVNVDVGAGVSSLTGTSRQSMDVGE
jgi:hypothetical protein